MNYGTVYGQFHGTIWARDEAERDIMIELRGLGENPSAWCDTTYPYASDLFAKSMRGEGVRDIDVAHALLFLSHLALACGLPVGSDDLGWHHEALHWLANRSGDEWVQTEQRIREVERAVPGHVDGAGRFKRNEYGTPVREFTCTECGETFTVCPAPLEPWSGCTAPQCSSYDPARDAEVLFMTDAEVAALPVVDVRMLKARRDGALKSEQ